MRLKYGEYVRTDKGTIGKVIEIRLGTNEEMKKFINIYIFDNGKWTIKDYVVKHSPNIIDLLEVGDYVNGKRVFATDNRINDNGEKVILTENYDEWTDNGVISNKDIKSIVTKEQYSSIEYRLED